MSESIVSMAAKTNKNSKSQFWPPFKNLYDYIEHVKFELGSLPEVNTQEDAFIKMYQDWLVKGMHGFGSYSSSGEPEKTAATATRTLLFPLFRTLDNGMVEEDGTEEVVIDEKMGSAGKQVGFCLDLDEDQALYLIHMWQGKNTKRMREEEDDAVLSDDGHVSMKQLASIVEMYCEERFYLLKSLEEILWIGEEPTDCPARDFIERLIGDLLGATPDVEDATVKSLRSYIEYRSHSEAQKTVIMGRGRDDASYSWAILMVAAREKERATLLSILMFLYYQPRKQCTTQRFLELMSTLCGDHALRSIQNMDATEHQHTVSDRLAILLLLEILVLDIGQPLRMVAEGQSPCGGDSHYIFLEKNIMEAINKAMKAFAASHHYLSGPLVLTWASIVIVLGNDRTIGSELVSLLNHHSSDTLKQYLSLVNLPGQSRQLHGLIMYHALSILLTSFGLDPETMPAEKTHIVTKIISTTFQESSVNDNFLMNLGDALTEPFLKYVDGCAALFPACPVYLLDLLSSLCVSYEGSLFVIEYFKKIHNVTIGYKELESYGIEVDSMGYAVATNDIVSLGHGFIIQQGTRGRCVSAPPGTTCWSGDFKTYISWNVQMGDHQSTMVLLLRLLQGIGQLTHSDAAHCGLLGEMESILQFYGSVFSSNDLFVVEILNQSVPYEDMKANRKDIDFISLLGSCMSNLVFARSNNARLEMHGVLSSCFKVLSFIVPYSPNRVFNALASGLEISTVQLRLSRTLPSGSALPMFDQMMASWASGNTDAYDSVLQLFQLVSVFLQTMYGPIDNVVSLALGMTRVAVPYIACQTGGKQKWNLAAACITIVRHSLQVQGHDSDAFTLEKEVLRMIYPLLPPNSKHILHDVHHQEEAEAIEKCCVKWLRLVPVLLAGSSKTISTSSQGENSDAGKLFNEDYLFTSVDGVSPSPAATLLSYLSYPYFCSEDKAEAVRSISFLLNFDSKVPITAFLPKNGARLSLFEPCMVIANAVNSESPTHEDSLFGAACDVLCASVLYHPTLAVLLLPDIRDEGTGPEKPMPCSCTQHILSFAERAVDLYQFHPCRLEKVLDVICGSITSKTSRNGIIKGLLSNKNIWTAFIQVLKNVSSEKIDDRLSENVINHLAIEMKIMDIFVAILCSDIKSTSPEAWKRVDEAIKPHFVDVIEKLLNKYCGYVNDICISREILQARKLAALSGIQVLALTSDNLGFHESLKYEDDSFIARLHMAVSSLANLNEDSLRNSCQSLYEQLMGSTCDQQLLHSSPFKSISDLLLTPIVKGTPSSFGTLTDLEPGCLPIRIGSAWGKLIREFSDLEFQMTFLKKLLCLQESLFESLRSLDSFTAASINSFTEVFPKDMDLSPLLNALSHLMTESLNQEDLLDLDEGIAMRMGLGLSRIASLASQKVPKLSIHAGSFFHLLLKLADDFISEEDVEFSIKSKILSNLLVAGISILGQSASRSSEFADVCSSLMPKVLRLSCNACSSIACPAASLAAIMMKLCEKPASWEENLESLRFLEAFDLIFAQLKEEEDISSPQFNDLAIRTKSLLIVISQITSDSPYSSEVLVNKGLGDVLVALCHVLSEVLPNSGYANTQCSSNDDDSTIDVAGRYLQNGTRYEMHNVYCILLSLCSLLWTAMPGHRKVQALLLRASVVLSERLILALQVPHWDQQIITLGYVEEARATFGLICTLARLDGEWLLTQPTMMSQLRRITAQFLDFAAHDIEKIQYVALSPEEIKKCERQFPNVKLSHAFGVPSVSFIPLDANTTNLEETASLNVLSFTMGLHIYTMIKYALHFQIVCSPEICEAESKMLRDTWVSGNVLEDLTTRVASSLLNILDEEKEVSLVNPGVIDSTARLIEICVEIIKNAESLMEVISHSLPGQTQIEVQGILQRASISMQ